MDFFLFLTAHWMPIIRNSHNVEVEWLYPWSVFRTFKSSIVQLNPIISSMTDRIILLLRMLELPTDVDCKAGFSTDLVSIAEELIMRSGFMKDAIQSIENRLSEKINNDFINSNRAETLALKRLTILASIFLPLSLSAGILSMGNRLVDIHLILWDFASLGLNLGALASLFVWINKFINLSKLFHLEGFKRELYGIWRLSMLCTFGIGSVLAVLIAFNIGMFGNVQTGWRVLVFGLAASIGCGVLAAPLFLCAYLCFVRTYAPILLAVLWVTRLPARMWKAIASKSGKEEKQEIFFSTSNQHCLKLALEALGAHEQHRRNFQVLGKGRAWNLERISLEYEKKKKAVCPHCQLTNVAIASVEERAYSRTQSSSVRKCTFVAIKGDMTVRVMRSGASAFHT